MPPELAEQLRLLVSIVLGRTVGRWEELAAVNAELRRKLLQETDADE